MNILDIEQDDTLVLTMAEGLPPMAREKMLQTFRNMYGNQQIKIVLLPFGTKMNLIKSSNLEDGYDASIRKDNPALQEAWEQYQIVLKLARK